MKKVLLILVFVATSSFCIGQNLDLYQKVYDKSSGFEIDHASTMAFDDNGFLWIGGRNLDNRVIISKNNKNILQRFNGFSFDNMPLPESKEEIAEINHIYKNSNGLFYLRVAFNTGYAYYALNPKTSEYTELIIGGSHVKIGYSDVFHYDGNNYVLGQIDRVVFLYKLNDDLTSEKLFEFTSSENKFIVEDSTKIIGFKDFLVISDDNFQTLYFDWKGNLINSEKYKNKVWIDELFVKDSNVYTFTNRSPNLHKINEQLHKLEPINSNPNVESLHLKTLNDNWGDHKIIAFNNEILSLNNFDGQSIENQFGIPLKNCEGIAAISENLSKDLWVATTGRLMYFKFPETKVKTFLQDTEIRAIKAVDSNKIIVATQNKGWYHLNLKKQSVRSLKSKSTSETINFYNSVNIIEDGSNYWTNDQYNIVKVNKETLDYELSKHFPVNCLEELNDSLLVYGTKRYHLMQYNKNTKEHIPLVLTDSLHIFDIAIKDETHIVCASDKGLLHYNFNTKQTQFYGSDTLKDSFLLMVDYDEDYGFLSGSRNGLIYHYDEENQTFKTIYKDDFSAGIATIIPQKNSLWINTFDGYVDYDLGSKKVERYSDKDGFSHNEANRYSATTLDSLYIVGTLGGINVFNPKDLKPDNIETNLVLTKINNYNPETSTFTTTYNQNNFENNSSIILPAENRALELDFALNNTYSRDKGYNFKYRLDNRDWIELNQQNSISFPNLASGLFNLEIIASDFSGNPVGNPLIVKINSKEFFYKTWWFIVAISCLVIGVLLYFLRQFQLRKKLQDQFALDLIQSQEKERKRIARELHDSVSQQLTLIKRKAQNTNQDEISELTNNTLEEVRHISRGLYPPLLKQLGLTESIEQLALDIDENNDLFVSTEIDNIDDRLNDEQSLHLYRFVQECINNIIKHANAKALSVSIEKQKDSILVQIKDNGVGFDVSQAKSKHSLGLKTLEERIKILNGNLIIQSKPNKGTTTTANLPI